MPAVEKEVSHKSGWRPEIGIGQVLPVPALVVVQEQYHAAEDKVDHDYAQENKAIAKGQEEHADKEVEGVVVDDIRLEDKRVDQPDHKQEQGTPYGHCRCPVDVPETDDPKADPGQHHECRGGPALKRADEYTKRASGGGGADDAAVPGASHNLEVHNDHAGKGQEPGKVKAVQACGAGDVGGGCVGQGFIANLSLSNWMLKCASVVSNIHNAFPMKSVARLGVKPDACVDTQNLFMPQLPFSTPELSNGQTRLYLKPTSFRCDVGIANAVESKTCSPILRWSPAAYTAHFSGLIPVTCRMPAGMH